MNPFPGDRSVLIVDNASIHKSDQLQRGCEVAGIRLEFLSPYSPDYNPVSLELLISLYHSHMTVF